MSALGIQPYDGRLNMGMRQNYNWPGYDMNQQYAPQPMNTMTPYTDATAMPSYARSLSYSPPRSVLTPEQRERKRQQDMVRRSSKTRIRRERSASGSVNTSETSTPDLIPRTIPTYSPAMVSRPLPTDDGAHMGTPNYMASFPGQLSAAASPELFGAQFQMPTNDFSLNDYPVSYPPTAADASLSMYSPRHLPLPSSEHQPAPYPNASVGSPAAQDGVRVVQSRPKPQCFEHGCNGRQFSTFSNLLRHQREKSGVAAKAVCPKCGAEFTRTTARNGHMAHEKCKTRRNS